MVDVGGPVANILFGAGAYYWFQRQAKFTAFSYSLWLFAALNLLVAAGYLCYSGVSNWDDWASAIRELHPQYAWRAAISLAGILLYILVVRLLCRSLIKLVREGGIGRSDVRRLIYRLPHLWAPCGHGGSFQSGQPQTDLGQWFFRLLPGLFGLAPHTRRR
jgi:hypothetical protein